MNKHEFQYLAIKSKAHAFTRELLIRLKAAGYKKVWIDTSRPGWGKYSCNNNIVCEPGNVGKVDGLCGSSRYPLWDILTTLKHPSCGNGRDDYIQAQAGMWHTCWDTEEEKAADPLPLELRHCAGVYDLTGEIETCLQQLSQLR